MNIDKISAGDDLPNEFNVIVEIPLGGDPIKYEIDKASGAVFVDRFLHTSMVYPANYGFIPHTLSEDGDACDVLIVGRRPLMPGCVIPCRPIGALVMEDESGQDEKILAVPADKLHPFYHDVKSYKDLPEILIQQITHFFEHYKDLESNKWSKVTGWVDTAAAKQLVIEGLANEKSAKAA